MPPARQEKETQEPLLSQSCVASVVGAQPGSRLRAQRNAARPGAPAFVTSRLFRPPDYSVPSEKYFEGGTNSASRRLLDEPRSEEHTSELQSLMRISYAVFCLKKKH